MACWGGFYQPSIPKTHNLVNPPQRTRQIANYFFEFFAKIMSFELTVTFQLATQNSHFF
ncbi:hypothetical protein [Microcoleus sp. A003_D6]|uniref:hypothetical protein n=1 Tax=Microcoleus sp. A003_D6 TaxID=3055266 RepID=UPI003FA56CA5